MKHQIPYNRDISCPEGNYKFSKRYNAMELTNLSVSRSVGRWYGLWVGRSVGWLVGRLVGQLVGWSVGHLVNWSVSQSVIPSVSQSVN
jgi:hypothetical protein